MHDFLHKKVDVLLATTIIESGLDIPSVNTLVVEEAEEMGLVNQVFDRDEFFEQVADYVKQFLPPQKAAGAVGRIKRSVQSGLEMSFQEGLALERELQQHLFQSEDAHEGLAAYVEKRTPQFKAK